MVSRVLPHRVSDEQTPRPSTSFSPFASTRNSSTTTLHDAHAPAPFHLSERLEEEIQRDERRIEAYGGDDPLSPPLKQEFDLPPPPKSEGSEDPNLVTWDSPEDPANPQNWSNAYKWWLVLVCAALTVNVTFASSAPTATILDIQAEFHVSSELTYMITTCFLLGYVVGPVIWGPASELVGRRPIFLLTLSAYTVLHLGQALAKDMTTLLVTRFLAGVFAVSPLTNSSGVIVDLFDPVGRGPATSLFTVCVFLGPVLGPILGGYVSASFLGWRWVFWIMMIFAGSCTLLAVVALPETYPPVLLAHKARRLRRESPANAALHSELEMQDWSLVGVLRRTLLRPFTMLAREPILVLVTLYLSVVYGILYALFEALPVIFALKRGFTTAQVGLVFIGVGLGTTLGCAINFRATAHYPALMVRWRGFPPPEERLFGAMLAGPALVAGCFWLGWAGEYTSVPWYVPALATVLIGMSVSLVFMSFLSYLVDTYLMYAASAMAANTFIRSAVAAAFPLFTVQMFERLGVGYACTLLGLVSLVLAPSPFLFYKYGPGIRARSKFAPCVDLKIKAELDAEDRLAKAEV